MASESSHFGDLWQWLERVVHDGRVHQDNVASCFSSQSDDDVSSPATRLHQFVTSHTKTFDVTKYTATLLMVQAASTYAEKYVTVSDKALLRATEAMLRNNRFFEHRKSIEGLTSNYGPSESEEDASTALALYLESAELFRLCGNDGLRRHQLWRAGALLYEQGKTSAAAKALIDACLGPPQYATNFLYFSIATRYLRLPSEERRYIRSAVFSDLAAAYARLPAHNIYKEVLERPLDSYSTFSIEDSVSPSSQQALRLLKRKLQTSEVLPKVNEAAYQEFAGDSLASARAANRAEDEVWSATVLDRVGILVMLADTDGGDFGSPERRWQYEAAQYAHAWDHLKNWNEKSERHNDQFSQFLSNIQQHIGEHRPALLKDVWSCVPIAVHHAMKAGKPDQAEALIRIALDGASPKQNLLNWAGLQMRLSRCIASSRSSEEAILTLRAALTELSMPQTQTELSTRAALLRQLAFIIKNTGKYGNCFSLLTEALELAGRAADVIGICAAMRIMAEYHSHMGNEAGIRQCNSLIRSLCYAWATPSQMLDFYYQPGFGDKHSISLEEGFESLTQLLSGTSGLDLTKLSHDVALALQQHGSQFAPKVISSLPALFDRIRDVGAHPYAVKIIEALQKLSLTPETDHLLRREYISRLDIALNDVSSRRERARLAALLIDQVAPLLLNFQNGLIGTDFAAAYEPLVRAKQALRLDSNPDQENALNEADGSELEDDLDVHAHTMEASTLSQIQQFLNSRDACAIDFVDSGVGVIAVCLTGDRVQVFRCDFAGWERLKSRIRVWMRQCGLTYDDKKRPLDNLTTLITDGYSANRKAILHEFESLWSRASSSLLPDALNNFISGYTSVYISPHRRLYEYPFHLARLSNGLLFCKASVVFYAASFTSLVELPQSLKLDCYILINKDDHEIDRTSLELLSPQLQNHWNDEESVEGHATRMQEAKISVLITHGVRHYAKQWRSSLCFPRGGRMDVQSIRKSSRVFTGCEILAIACHSGAAKTSDAAANLGVAGAFLERGATAVLASMWRPIVQDGVRFASGYLLARQAGHGRGEAYQKSLVELIDNAHTTGEGLLHAAPFYLFGVERAP